MKRNIANDILNILKNVGEDELYYTVLDMLNGTYQYNKRYLNKLEQNIIDINIEKILLVSSNKKTFNNAFEYIEAINNLNTNILYIDEYKLNKDIYLNMKCFIKEKCSFIHKSNFKRVSAVILLGLLFMNLGINQYEKNKETALIENQKKHIEHLVTYDAREKHLIALEKIENDLVTNAINVEEQIQNEYNLTEEQYDILVAICLSEAESDSYEDTYAVINTIYNRTISTDWNNYCNNYYGEKVGDNLYYQATMKGQFVVYEEGIYKRNLGVRDGIGYEAIIDFLTSKNMKHNYLSFRAHGTYVRDSVSFSEKGNNYFNYLDEHEKIVLKRTK